MRLAFALAAVLPCAADFPAVNPAVFGPDDPRAKELPRMVAADQRRRTREANERESRAFAAVNTRAEWEAYRDPRLTALRDSLGTFPDPPRDIRVVITTTLAGDGFTVRNLVYESRPGYWVTANLYLPANPPAKMPGLLISHAHHTPKTHGELQDMGMTWARAGCAVLVPDHLGHGERRTHPFASEKDYAKPFRPSRQDYYFRYNTNLQLSALGDSLMGWMVWDLMRGVDVLLKQPTIDPGRIVLLGAVAGGGDPAGVTAALDPRVSCLVPFNFGGWQPESSPLENPDRDFAWFGEGYWESTRGLKGGAAGRFAHFVIVGSVAPRPVVYAHEFAWDPKTDPAWPRLERIFGFYGAKDRLAVAHGAGKVSGPAGPENTHCTHIGAVHRRMIYPALKAWFDMPVPEEYSKRRPAEELLCWTDAARAELKPRSWPEVLGKLADDRAAAANGALDGLNPAERRALLQKRWAALLGDTEPGRIADPIEGRAEDVPGGRLTRFALETEPGIVVPLLLISPTAAKGKPPVVVMVAQAGKGAFLKERGDVIAAFLKAGVAVCLADVRGTGETKPGDGSAGRGGSRTSLSQTELILGRPLLGAQLRDLRTVIRWLRDRPGLDGKRLAVWGDSFAPAGDGRAAPLDAPDLPPIAEPGGAQLAVFAALFEGGVKAAVARGGVVSFRSVLDSPFLYVPHAAVVPGAIAAGDMEAIRGCGLPLRESATVDGRNRATAEKPDPPADAAAWAAKVLGAG